MLNSAFDAITGNRLDLYPEALRPEIDRWNALIYPDAQQRRLSRGLRQQAGRLRRGGARGLPHARRDGRASRSNRYLAGEYCTEADWRAFTTLVRFDVGYHGAFKCNLRRIEDYPALRGYLRELYQWPGIAGTVDLEEIKRNYYSMTDKHRSTRSGRRSTSRRRTGARSCGEGYLEASRVTPDLIVIGGGSAGAACAARLAQGGKRVLLVEAGKSDNDIRSKVPALMSGIVHTPEFDWMYKAEPDSSVGGRADVWPAGKRLGGGSAINGMMFVRGHKWDYDHWAELGATGWDYASVLPYFRRMEDNERGADEWRGEGGPIAVSEVRSRYAITDDWIEAVQQAGIRARSTSTAARPRASITSSCRSARGLRHSTAARLSRAQAGRPRHAARSASAEDRDARTAARPASPSAAAAKCRHCMAREGVVLCAGALNTPRLLMLSGIGPAKALRDARHRRRARPAGRRGEPAGASRLPPGERGLRAHAQRRCARARRGEAGARAGDRPQRRADHRHRPCAGVREEPRRACRRRTCSSRSRAFAFDDHRQGQPRAAQGSSVSTLRRADAAASRGRITLRSADPDAPPVIEHRLLGDEDDAAQLVEGLEIARRIMAQPAIAAHVTGERPARAARREPRGSTSARRRSRCSTRSERRRWAPRTIRWRSWAPAVRRRRRRRHGLLADGDLNHEFMALSRS